MSSDPGAGNLFDRLKNRLSGEKKEKSKDHLEKKSSIYMIIIRLMIRNFQC